MRGITIVGLGPGSPDLLTMEAYKTLESATEVWVRTRRHPTVAALPGNAVIESFDSVYEAHDSFESLYQEIADRVVALGRRPEGVIYAVPGHPAIGEASVPQIRASADREGLPVRIMAGLSFVEPALTALGIDALEQGLQIADATDLAAHLYPFLTPDRPALIAQLYSRMVAGEVKLTLMALYPDDHPTRLVQSVGTDATRVVDLPLYEIDRQPWVDHLTSLYVPPRQGLHSLEAFADVVAQLRAPDGCPWDKEQSHQSLRTALLEETYEVLSALDRDDMDDLREELGDLFMQIVMHAQMASEGGIFNLADVIADVRKKIVRRHPHVFGDVRVANTEEVLQNWEQIKNTETGKEGRRRNPFAGVPTALPALVRAHRIADKATRLGWNGQAMTAPWTPILSMLEEALVQDTEDDVSRSRQVGQFLFVLANWARRRKIDAEAALREASDQFIAEFDTEDAPS